MGVVKKLKFQKDTTSRWAIVIILSGLSLCTIVADDIWTRESSTFGTVGHLIGFTALAMVVSGVFALIRSLKRKRVVYGMKKYGCAITATVVDCAPIEYFIGKNGRKHRAAGPVRFAITCSADIDGATRQFHSVLRADPTPYLPAGRVTVYYDKDDWNKYFVDVDKSIGRPQH